MEKVKFVQIGCGKMSIYTMKYAMENGYEIVGAVDINPDVIGKDVSSVIGCEEVGVAIRNVNELDPLLKEVKPNVAMVTTMSLMNDLEEVLMTCAKNGVNAITTCEEAFYPFNSSPRITKELDMVAKLSDNYASLRDEILETIRYYEDLIDTIEELIRKQAEAKAEEATKEYDISGVKDFS